MTERFGSGEPKMVSIPYDLRIFSSEDFRLYSWILYKYQSVFSFRNTRGVNMFMVLSSDDESLSERVASFVGNREGQISEEFIEGLLEIKAKRRPQASLNQDSGGKSYVECKEPTCFFHKDGGCSYNKAVIYDDGTTFQWCMTYEPQETASVKGKPTQGESGVSLI